MAIPDRYKSDYNRRQKRFAQYEKARWKGEKRMEHALARVNPGIIVGRTVYFNSGEVDCITTYKNTRIGRGGTEGPTSSGVKITYSSGDVEFKKCKSYNTGEKFKQVVSEHAESIERIEPPVARWQFKPSIQSAKEKGIELNPPVDDDSELSDRDKFERNKAELEE